MQKRISRQAGAANVSRIPVNFGFNQNYMALCLVAFDMGRAFTQFLEKSWPRGFEGKVDWLIS